MFKKISYQKKYLGLIIVFSILSIISYKRSFKTTISTKNTVAELTQKLNLMNKNTDDIQLLSKKIKALDMLIGKEIEPELVQHFLIDYMTQFKDITIVQLEEVHRVEDNSFNIFTNQLVLEGTYNHLIKAIYSFELESDISRIISINYYTEKEYKQNRTKLFVKLIFQNYEKNI